MYEFHTIFGKLFTGLFYPFRFMSPWWALTIISLLTAFFMLLVFRKTSNQSGIHTIKNKIKAHLLEIRLYKDSLLVSLKAQGRILLSNFKYINYMLKPMMVMILPLILIIVQLNFWFGYEPVKPGTPTILKIRLNEGFNPSDSQISLESLSPELIVESPSLRIDEEKEIDWRFSVKEPGNYGLRILLGAYSFEKTIHAENRPLIPISPLTVRRGIFREFLYPVEKPLAADVPLENIEIVYPGRMMNLFGWRIHWLIVYFAQSMIFGFAFKGIFKVDF